MVDYQMIGLIKDTSDVDVVHLSREAVGIGTLWKDMRKKGFIWFEKCFQNSQKSFLNNIKNVEKFYQTLRYQKGLKIKLDRG